MSTTSKQNRLGNWNPEDEKFWNAGGKKHANRNLAISVPALMLAFCVWQIWSVVATRLNEVGFNLTDSQLFMLASLPGLSGATLRIFYTFMPGIFGGKNWTVVSTAALLIPCIGIGLAVQDPTTSYTTLMILATLCGLGGANFSSSMANIGYFFPKKVKGNVLGINGGIGNMGVSVIQFLAPIVITSGIFGVTIGANQVLADGSEIALQNAAFVWVIPIVLVTIAAIFGMDNVPGAKQTLSSQLVVLKRKHTWIMSLIYTCCFGSFIGFAAGFMLISKKIFPDSNYVALAFIGPLLGALTRWAGGWLADKWGGTRVTLYAFVVMIVAAFGAVYFIGPAKSFYPFFFMMLLLFASAGVANGSTFCMIPRIFPGHEAAPVTGFTAAIAAYGAFFIPKLFGWSFNNYGTGSMAFYVLIAYYIFSLALTWYFYGRKNAEVKC